ncbi:MAG: tail fiber protein [Pseudomonadota bacterium]
MAVTSVPFLGQIIPFAGDKVPRGWLACDGQELQIADHQPLFSLLGSHFGGDGETTFALPNLTQRAPMGQGTGETLTPREVGQVGGDAQVTLSEIQNPIHNHTLMAQSDPLTTTHELAKNDSVLGAIAEGLTPAIYGDQVGGGFSLNNVIGDAGQSAPHPNQQPFLTLSFIINVSGIFPARG